MSESSIKNIRVAESTHRRIFELREYPKETVDSVLKRCLNVPIEESSKFSRFVELNCRLTGKKCFGNAQCNVCEVGLDYIKEQLEKGSF